MAIVYCPNRIPLHQHSIHGHQGYRQRGTFSTSHPGPLWATGRGARFEPGPAASRTSLASQEYCRNPQVNPAHCAPGSHFFFCTWPQSYLPRTTLSLTPGRSWVRPPCTSTTWCSCKVWPSPGIKQTASRPVLSRTRQHLRLAELGFLGLRVNVRRTTPFSCGRPSVGPSFGGGHFGGPRRCI